MTNNNITLNDVLENPSTPIEDMFNKKQEFIKNQSANKQNSMRDFAVKRDATMFAVAELSKTDTTDAPTEAVLKMIHDKWLLYFETVYGENGHE